MSRNNLDKVKEAFRKLSSEILRYGDKGESDLRDLFELHKPEVIFKLDQGPDKQARLARLLGEMRNLADDLAREESKSPLSHKPESTSVTRVIHKNQTPGNYDRFKYILTELPNGRWSVKITKQGRNIIQSEGAPKIIDHPDLLKTFKDKDHAELAIRRVINAAMIWYAERGITPQEKHRKTKTGRAGIQRRTAGQVEARSMTESQIADLKAEEKRREKIRLERRNAKVAKHEKSRRPGNVESSPGRKLVFIPRKNPESNFSWIHKEDSAIRQAERSAERYNQYAELWKESLSEGRPNFKVIFKAYDSLENARANYTIAGKSSLSKDMAKELADTRKLIINILEECSKKLLSGPKENPSVGDHIEFAASHIDKANKFWDKYSESNNVSDLLKSFTHLGIAKEEYQHSGDKEGCESAMVKMKIAKKEILKRTKGK